ncbi:ParH-like protein [Streptomyces cocklensis]|uniref:ParH-like protein n=1 Tax=Actinacidiphila cocklensis TaxID=887465 RepID=UPI00203B507B|nr:ParH-like protein [Actinacidiphila cocklensis]MDD1062728.1 ParH-like protein [Actinacidiphila cocklensis]
MTIDRGHRRLWRSCRRTVDALELPVPFDTADFIRALAARRGRPIELIPVSARPHLPCGVLVTTAEADLILYAVDTTPLHQQHILLHEAAHLLCGHHDDGSALAAAAGILIPGLPTALVERVLGRTVYTEPQEHEAELVASLILSRVTPQPRPQARTEAARLEVLFGRPEPPGPDTGSGPGSGSGSGSGDR